MILLEETIKHMLAARGLSQYNFIDAYTEKTGKPTSREKLFYRITKDILYLTEMQTKCKILGYGVVFTKKNEKQYTLIGDFENTLAALLKIKDMSQTDLREIFNERTGSTFVKQSFSRKIKTKTITIARSAGNP